MKLFIADDEIDVREGLRFILDWSELGFFICGEGKNGYDTLDQILKLQPDVVLMDIRMPKLSGLEVVRLASEQGFHGKFIILSGYSDFSYAQEAIRYGVTNYLTKPIDEVELEKAIIQAKETLISETDTHKKLVEYRNKARDSILQDILLNQADYSYLDVHDLMLEASMYQVVLYTNFNQDSFQNTWDFAGILRLANKNHNALDYIELNHQHIILMKGNVAINRFQELLDHYISPPQKGSPLDSLFLTYGKPVYSVEQIHISYEDAALLMKRRFFCNYDQHVLGYLNIPESQPFISTNSTSGQEYARQLAGYIQSGSRHMVHKTLEYLREAFYHIDADITELKHNLADILLEVKSIINHSYNKADIPFPNNAAIISSIEEKYYLDEILQFFTVQFDMCMNAIGTQSRESVMDGILDYIAHNYQENLKLNTIAELFGYNSSYLGKLLTKSIGKSFNSYLDEVRIENSKKLLRDETYKVYEIAQLVGYTNVDYFHKKFRKYVGMSPAEYRKENL
ncbi:response regulator [Blautia coccoides]|uniref:Stage 0 sporulation protein A homolog n=1 Tax=Blautia hominis TaxID=2025493 RepID=A0ABQ0BKN6_9FIRM|nr:response regulator [Blautia coccoides]MCQ4640888.1 response regulator [Blautia coccoides]